MVNLLLLKFISLIKLVFCLAKMYDDVPPMIEIKNAICRNFSGMNEIEPWEIFKKKLNHEAGFTSFPFLFFLFSLAIFLFQCSLL